MTRPLSCIVLPLAFSFFACHQSRQSGATVVADAGISDSLAASVQGMYAGEYSKGILRLMIIISANHRTFTPWNKQISWLLAPASRG